MKKNLLIIILMIGVIVASYFNYQAEGYIQRVMWVEDCVKNGGAIIGDTIGYVCMPIKAKGI